MTMEHRNQVVLEGQALEAPAWSHDNHGTRFFRFFLRVPRLSGQWDELPILLPEALAPQVGTEGPLRVQGELRSFNNRSGVGRRLVLAVYAQNVQPGLGQPCNEILLSGSLCKPPVYRKTPLGRSICDLMLATPRRCGRADYLPVIAWGQLASQTRDMGVGDALSLEGRVQSRIYHKATEDGVQERTAYEVSMMHRL
ncbi:MAG: single-stranded DNA-binding protein [Oscillibacter sp.]|nr:single-stranded DNA-binding protein [Oscillibacter sp.]